MSEFQRDCPEDTTTETSLTGEQNLSGTLHQYFRMKNTDIDLQQLSALTAHFTAPPSTAELIDLLTKLGCKNVRQFPHPEGYLLPLIARHSQYGWGIITDVTADGTWELLINEMSVGCRAEELEQGGLLPELLETRDAKYASSFRVILRNTLYAYAKTASGVFFASVFIGLLAIVTSLFSMQVYDRVIPTKGHDTLFVLVTGVMFCVLFELVMKFARSKIMHHITINMDATLSKAVFERFLSVRLDQMPDAVGSLAGQLKGYEQVRSFFTSSAVVIFVDVPVALICLMLMMVLAGPVIAVIPVISAILAFSSGHVTSKRIQKQALEGARFSNLKTGVLVEAVEGAETIKSGSGNWKFLSRWINLNNRIILNDTRTRSLSDGLQYITATLQQVSYIGVISIGAIVIMDGSITTGALIACSILSGRVLAPVIASPNIIVQYAHTLAAINGLERLYALECDNHHTRVPLIPSALEGNYHISDVCFCWPDKSVGLTINNLTIRTGEKIAILGPIGAGKSTLLKLLCGLYAPGKGRVYIDNLDIQQISRLSLNRQVGYLQQEHRLFHGTVRENLLTGLPDIPEHVLYETFHQTGMDTIIKSHAAGLDRVISEGGKGLSGGQRQLLAFTRLMLGQQKILLLDEPTANMDHEQEKRCIDSLKKKITDETTLVIVTHKPVLLPLVDRIIIVAENKIVLDGERNEVIRKLQQGGV